MPDPTTFLACLPSPLPRVRADCAQVLAWCRPQLDALVPEPPQGWLRLCYDTLANRLFPAPSDAVLTEELRQGVDGYAAALEFCIASESGCFPFDPLTDIPALTERECARSRIPDEIPRFFDAIRQAQFVALLRLGRAVMPFDPASHMIGVHALALDLARQAAASGLPVDVALTSAAALSHDIGKFGCRGAEIKLMPKLHYRYTDDWLRRQNLPGIAEIAAHHAIWEMLEDELPLEEKLLIYADVRVRGTRENGREIVRIYTLAEADAMIQAKLLDPTPEKVQRFRRAFDRLTAFERSLQARGVRLL